MRICPGCGIIAPTARTACGACRTDFVPLEAPGRVGSIMFACIHGCEFTCRACGIKSPLGTLDLEGQAECWGCGILQAFDVAQWKDALGHAHGVADLSGFAHSRHSEIGTQYTSSTKTQNGLIMDAQGTRHHSLATTVSPGHPLCKACRFPLDVAVDGGGTRTSCRRCGAAASYALPPRSAETYPALRGIIAAEARSDVAPARVVRGAAGVEAPGCPQCGATLTAGEGEIVNCTYCRANARIPGRLARQQRRGQAPPKMTPFWILFDGMSPGRRNIARGREEDAEEDGAPLPEFGFAANPNAGPPPFVHHPPPPVYVPPPSRSPAGFMFGAVGLGIVIAMFAVAYWMVTRADDSLSPTPTTQPAKAKPKKK